MRCDGPRCSGRVGIRWATVRAAGCEANVLIPRVSGESGIRIEGMSVGVWECGSVEEVAVSSVCKSCFVADEDRASPDLKQPAVDVNVCYVA